VGAVTVLGSYEGLTTISRKSGILLEEVPSLVTAQDAGRPSPPTPLPEGEGRFVHAFGIFLTHHRKKYPQAPCRGGNILAK
jgi:hypothetical protein